MKRKYISPHVRLINIGANSILASSGPEKPKGTTLKEYDGTVEYPTDVDPWKGL